MFWNKSKKVTVYYDYVDKNMGRCTTHHLAHGHLDNVLSNQLHVRLQLAKELRGITGSLSSCRRCKFPHSLVTSHITWYTRGRGCEALCEDRWANLGTPERRLPYYYESFVEYKWSQWELIYKAVFAEGNYKTSRFVEAT